MAAQAKDAVKANSDSQLHTAHNIQESQCYKEITMSAVLSSPLISKAKPPVLKKRRQRYSRVPCHSTKKMAVQQKNSAESKALLCKKRLWEKYNNAAHIIQRNFKSYFLRKKWMNLVSQMMQIKKQERININRKRIRVKAAVVIQSWWRKIKAQKEFRILQAFKKRKSTLSKSVIGTTRNSIVNGNRMTYITSKLQSFSLSYVSEAHQSVKGSIPLGSLYFPDWEAILVLGGTELSASSGGMHVYSPMKNNQGAILKHGIRLEGSDILRFHPGTNVWEKVQLALPEGRHHHSCVFLAGLIYIVGGCSVKKETESWRKGNTFNCAGGGAVVGTTWVLDPANCFWKELSCLTIPRRDFSLIAANGCLYAMGGIDKNGVILASVEQYNPKKGRWSFVSPMPEPRVGHAAAKHHDLIWVAGGTSAPSPFFVESTSLLGSPSSHSIMLNSRAAISDSVFIYDPRADNWFTFLPLRFPRTYSSMLSINGSLFLVGGATRFCQGYQMGLESYYSGSNGEIRSIGTVDVLDGREWKLQAELAVPRHGHALSYLGTQLVIIGGMSSATNCPLNGVECFCSERKRWLSNMAFLPKPLCGQAAIALPPGTLM